MTKEKEGGNNVEIERGLRFEDLLFPKLYCSICHVELTKDNWSRRNARKNNFICKKCDKIERDRRKKQDPID